MQGRNDGDLPLVDALVQLVETYDGAYVGTGDAKAHYTTRGRTCRPTTAATLPP